MSVSALISVPSFDKLVGSVASAPVWPLAGRFECVAARALWRFHRRGSVRAGETWSAAFSLSELRTKNYRQEIRTRLRQIGLRTKNSTSWDLMGRARCPMDPESGIGGSIRGSGRFVASSKLSFYCFKPFRDSGSAAPSDFGSS